MEFPFQNVLIRFAPLHGAQSCNDVEQELFTISNKSLSRFATSPTEAMGELDVELSRFAKDCKQFKGKLRLNNAVVAGEFARSVLIGRETPKHLDILTSIERDARSDEPFNIIDYLCDSEGYCIDRDDDPKDEHYRVCLRNGMRQRS